MHTLSLSFSTVDNNQKLYIKLTSDKPGSTGLQDTTTKESLTGSLQQNKRTAKDYHTGTKSKKERHVKLLDIYSFEKITLYLTAKKCVFSRRCVLMCMRILI